MQRDQFGPQSREGDVVRNSTLRAQPSSHDVPADGGELDGTRIDRRAAIAPRKPKGFFQNIVAKAQGVIFYIFPPGGILSSAFNMASASIGAGILGLPGATDTSGLIMAMIYLVIITFFSVFSMHIMALAAQKTRIRSFEGMARWLFPGGNYAFSYWAAFVRWFHAFAGNVAYVISVGNCFYPIFKEALNRHPDNTALQYFNSTSGNRLLIALVWLCIMLPLVIPKHIDSLRYASMCAIAFMLYFVLIIIVHSCMNGLPEHRHNIVLSGTRGKVVEGDNIFLFRTGNSAVQGVGVFMFAYVCQINAYEVYWDMRPEIRTTKNYTWAAFLGMMICGVLYVCVCVFGYFDFGSAKLQNNSILLMYSPLGEPQVMVAYIGVLVKLCVAYALLTIAERNSIYYMMGWQTKYRHAKKSPKNGADVEPNVDELQTAVSVTAGEQDGDANNGFSPAAVEPSLMGLQESPLTELNDDLKATRGNGAAAEKNTADPLMVLEVDADIAETTAEDTTFVDNIPFWRHCLVVVIISVASLLCGLFIPKINLVFGFAGAISGGFLAFIFPSMFFMFSGDFTLKQAGWFTYFTTYALFLSGVVGIIFGTGGTIYGAVAG